MGYVNRILVKLCEIEVDKIKKVEGGRVGLFVYL
jgi:hypothetical protein